MAKEKLCGIYCIENLVNYKKYIGQSVDVYGRWNQHRSELRHNAHENEHLQNAWNLYKESSFCFYLLEECDNDALDERESYYIQLFDTENRDKGYNIESGGGHKFASEETRKKLSESAKVRFSVPENNPMLGKHHSEETKQKLREMMTGENHPRFGQKHSEESRKKMSNALIGHPMSDETRKKIGDKARGRKASAETKQKLSELRTGKGNPRVRAVYCPGLNQRFWGAKEAEELYGINASHICQCCGGTRKHAGRHPVTNELLTWCYIDNTNTQQND